MNALEHLFPRARIEVLRLLFDETQTEHYLRDLARLAAVSPAAMQKELKNLIEAGLVNSRRDGNRLYFQANQEHPLHPELRAMMAKTTGMAAQIKRAIEEVPGVDMAFLFGSQAAGTATSGSDVDLLILGSVGLRKLSPKLRHLAQSLGREINPLCLTTEEWVQKLARGEAFILRVASEPKIWLKGSEDELGKLG
jgi:predicted nucleotidyltransferase/DNA-binding HxlR family transcriptional regulator